MVFRSQRFRQFRLCNTFKTSLTAMGVPAGNSLMGYINQKDTCSSVVRAFAHGAMGRPIDPSWSTHYAISRCNQCSATGVTKAMVCVIMSME